VSASVWSPLALLVVGMALVVSAVLWALDWLR
jgi:hypothetical protein